MAQLDTSVEGIIDTMVDTIKDAAAAAAPGDSLSKVKVVVRGDRARPMPQLPCIWVVAQRANMVRNTFDTEEWILPLSLAALVKGDRPEEATKLSQSMAAAALRAVITLDPDDVGGADITDIVSTSFEPTARNQSNDRVLFWTEAVVTVTFTVI